jgi:hypothetical protein
MIVKLETHTQDGVGYFVSSISSVKEGLTEVSAKLESRLDVRRVVLFATFVQVLTKLPAALPCLLLNVTGSREAEHPLSVQRAKSRQGVA